MTRHALTIILVLVCFLPGCVGEKERGTITVFAASSTGPAMLTIAELFEAKTGIIVHLNVASSSTLARQVESGAPCDVFLSANQQWMEYLSARHRQPFEATALLGNDLVLVKPARLPTEGLPLTAETTLHTWFQGRLAMGDPSHVPAGIYGKESLVRLNWFDGIQDRIVATVNVRAALTFVERGEVELGLIYASDVITSKAVDPVFSIPSAFHEPIVYPLGLIQSNSAGANAFYQFLQSDEAGRIFERHGFRFLPKSTPVVGGRVL